jgi:hypothetical protein
MDAMIQYVKDNAEWIFSGIGVSVLAAIVYLVRSTLKRQSSQRQSVDRRSTGIQAGGNVEIKIGEKDVP